MAIRPLGPEAPRNSIGRKELCTVRQKKIGCHHPCGTIPGLMLPRHGARRTLRFVVDLRANHLGPGWRERRSVGPAASFCVVGRSSCLIHFQELRDEVEQRLPVVDTTLNVYTQVLDGSVRDAAEKVGGELFSKLENADSAEGG